MRADMQMMFSILFYFKQKREYERRISDWSADVCSSDLVPRGSRLGPARRRQEDRPDGPRQPHRGPSRSPPRRIRGTTHAAHARHTPHDTRRTDRTSVVHATSVSVSADPGSRRTINNKTHHTKLV